MIKAPIPSDEDARLRALHELQLLDSDPEERFDRITRLACRLLGVPIALVSLVDAERQWFKSRQGLEAPQTARDISFCGHAIAGREVLVVSDATKDERFTDNPLVTSDPNIRFYAGCPIGTRSGTRLGTLCVIDIEPRGFSDDDREVLRDLAALVERELELSAAAITASHHLYQPPWLTRFLSHAPVLLQSVTKDGKILYVNDTWKRTLGYDAPDIASLSILDVIAEQDRAHCRTLLAGLTADSKPSIVSLRYRTKLGRVVVVEGNLAVDALDDGSLVTVGIFRDVTVERRVTDAFQEVVTQAPIAIVLSGEDGAIRMANAEAHRMFRYAPGSLVGSSVGHLLSLAAGADQMSLRDELFRSTSSRLRMDSERGFMGLRGDGTEFPLEVSISKVEIGGELCVLEAFSDLTSRKEAEKHLEEARLSSDRASKVKSEFIAGMSHELRTPLSAVLGFAQLLVADEGATEQQRDYSREIEQAGHHLLSLIDDILDLSRVESGVVEMRLQSTSLAKAIRDAVAMTTHASAQCDVTVVNEPLVGNQEVRVLADAKRLRQVIVNLLSNAIKYNRRNGKVTISQCVSDTGVRLSISDTGHGIRLENQHRIFRSFDRLGAEHGPVEGTGIGLVLTKTLVEAMGGTIGFVSEEERGSTFWIELPYADADRLDVGQLSAQGAEDFVSKPKSALRGFANLAGWRVLVVDDAKVNHKLLRAQLSAINVVVDDATDAEEALVLWREKRHELVITDIRMPGMDGLQFAEALRREQDPTTRLVIWGLSAEVGETLRIECRQSGMDEVFEKPLTAEKLQERVAQFWGVAAELQERFSSQALEDPLFEIEQLYRYLGRPDLDLASELVQTFLDSSGEGLARLKADPGNRLALSEEIHKQSAGARLLGAAKYVRLLDSLRESVEKSQSPKSIVSNLEELSACIDAMAVQLAQILQRAAVGEVRSEVTHVVRPQLNVGTLLLVDDDPVSRAQLQSIVRAASQGKLLVASSAVDALTMLAELKRPVDVLLCDLHMPEQDGLELIRRCADAGYCKSVIIVSERPRELMIAASQLASAYGIHVLGAVSKPVEPEQMRALLAAPRERQVAVRRKSTPLTVLAEEDVRLALENREFDIWFQPKVDAASMRPLGVEALARWRKSDGSFVSPDSFIAVAEGSRTLIAELSYNLYERAIELGSQIRQEFQFVKIAINVSAIWLHDMNLPNRLAATAARSGIATSDIILEVTETGLIQERFIALDVLTRLRLKGFRLSIDDFGIGYSSFEQLRNLPFTELKLDKSFVGAGMKDETATAVLESSVLIARRLGLKTVAEGVETAERIRYLQTLGCDQLQGYFVAKPMPIEDVLGWIRERHES